MMVLAMIQIFLIMTMIMILRRSWREKDSYQFLRCLARVGSSQDQRTMFQVLIIIISVASMVLIMIRDRVFEAKMADNSKQTKTCEVAGPTGHTGVWSILGWISSRLIAVIRSERCATCDHNHHQRLRDRRGAGNITLVTIHIAFGWNLHNRNCRMRLHVLVQKRARVRERLHRLPEITFFSFFRVPPATKIVVTEVTSTDHTDRLL